MPAHTRRQYLQAAAATGVAGALGDAQLLAKPNAKGPGIKLTEIFNPAETDRWKLAKQIGLNHAIVGVSGVLSKVRREEYVSALTKVRDDFAGAGLKIAGVESHPVPAEKIKLGLPGLDEEIENYKAAIVALKRVGIPMVCYNWMAGLSWFRTNTAALERGGALTSEFVNEVAEAQGPTQWGQVSEEKVWANLQHFMREVMPVADKVGMEMALHPDDPPRSPLRGIGRILTSARNYRRVLDMHPSKMNGITFCQANFKAMGEDIEKLAKEWCSQKRVFFVHYRDIEGTRDNFRETFHDNGPSDMVKMLRIYSENGFTGPIRPDHAPTMEGESNARPGYAMMGKVMAFGFMKGAMQAMNLPYE